MEEPQQSGSYWETQQSFPFLVKGKCTPHVTDQIFQLLDQNTMAKCRLVAKDWKIFVNHRTSLWGLVSTGKYMKAVEEGRLDMCRLIVQKAESKNPHQKIIIGWEYSGRKRKAARLFLTPLHMAADKGHYDICRLLVKNIQNKHPRDHLGRTPLHNAARKGHLEICRLILDNVPANYQLPFDRNGVSPLDLAQAYQHTELVTLFGSVPVPKSVPSTSTLCFDTFQ